jgi:thiamine-phosphate pyrophosphorylase
VQPLNAIVDADAAVSAGWQPMDLADAFLRGGARFLQLRAKNVSSGALFELAGAMASRARACDALFVVNDRADIAVLADAGGVHVGQTDLSPSHARRLVGAGRVVGVSTHTMEQVMRALDEPVDYIAIGPVFTTATKATGYDAIGLEGVRRVSEQTRSSGVPLVAIGGITLDRAREVLDAGARSVAVIGDLLATADPERRVREYLSWLA